MTSQTIESKLMGLAGKARGLEVTAHSPCQMFPSTETSGWQGGYLPTAVSSFHMLWFRGCFTGKRQCLDDSQESITEARKETSLADHRPDGHRGAAGACACGRDGPHSGGVHCTAQGCQRGVFRHRQDPHLRGRGPSHTTGGCCQNFHEGI